MTHAEALIEADERDLAQLRKIKISHQLDQVFWEWSATFGFPKWIVSSSGEYEPITPQMVRRYLNEFMQTITQRLGSKVTAFGVIVHRKGKGPHAHLVLTSTKRNFLDEYNHRGIGQSYWPQKDWPKGRGWHCKIKNHTEIPQKQMIEYLFKPWNYLINSKYENFTEEYYFKKNQLDLYRAKAVQEV